MMLIMAAALQQQQLPTVVPKMAADVCRVFVPLFPLPCPVADSQKQAHEHARERERERERERKRESKRETFIDNKEVTEGR